MKKITTILLVCYALLALSACSLSAIRLFKAKVPPPVAKPQAQVETERQSADFIAKHIETPPSLRPVAQGLSQSLGAPENPIVATTPAQVDAAAAKAVSDMQTQLVTMQNLLTAQNKFLAKYAGKDIDGTGFSLLGPGMTVIIIALIALAVLCPPALTLMIFAFGRLKAAAGIVVNEVEKAATAPETQAAVATIKAKIGSAMASHPKTTTLLQDVVTNLKKV